VTLLERLRALGVPPDETLERLVRGELAFPDGLAEVGVEGPEHGIENLDPGFVPIAFVGNGDYYGLYLYPPLGGAPVVQFLHEVPCIEWVAPSLADFLDGNSQQPVAWEPILPTESRIARLKGTELLRWLVERCPAVSLPEWEREWVGWWVFGAHVNEHELIDYGLEAYRRLGWPHHVAALEAAAQWGPTDLGPSARRSRHLKSWARLHPPLGDDARAIVRRLIDGDPDARAIFDCWREDFTWVRAHLHADRREGRAELGEALLAAMPSPLAAECLLAFEFEEGLERVSGPLAAELQRLRAAHQAERSKIAKANDWSDVSD
jgi:hypothetical protein